MCAGVVEGNLCNRLWTLLYSPSPHRRLPRNAEALLASETRQLLKMLLALSWFPHLSGQKKATRGAAGPFSPWLYLEEHRNCKVQNRVAVAHWEWVCAGPISLRKAFLKREAWACPAALSLSIISTRYLRSRREKKVSSHIKCHC